MEKYGEGTVNTVLKMNYKKIKINMIKRHFEKSGCFLYMRSDKRITEKTKTICGSYPV